MEPAGSTALRPLLGSPESPAPKEGPPSLSPTGRRGARREGAGVGAATPSTSGRRRAQPCRAACRASSLGAEPPPVTSVCGHRHLLPQQDPARGGDRYPAPKSAEPSPRDPGTQRGMGRERVRTLPYLVRVPRRREPPGAGRPPPSCSAVVGQPHDGWGAGALVVPSCSAARGHGLDTAPRPACRSRALRSRLEVEGCRKPAQRRGAEERDEVAPSCTPAVGQGGGKAGGQAEVGSARGPRHVPAASLGVTGATETRRSHPRSRSAPGGDVDLAKEPRFAAPGVLPCRGLGSASPVTRWDLGSPELWELHGVMEQSVRLPPSPPFSGAEVGRRMLARPWPASFGAAWLGGPSHPASPRGTRDPQGTTHGDPKDVPPSSPASPPAEPWQEGGRWQVGGCYEQAGLGWGGLPPPPAENTD